MTDPSPEWRSQCTAMDSGGSLLRDIEWVWNVLSSFFHAATSCNLLTFYLKPPSFGSQEVLYTTTPSLGFHWDRFWGKGKAGTALLWADLWCQNTLGVSMCKLNVYGALSRITCLIGRISQILSFSFTRCHFKFKKTDTIEMIKLYYVPMFWFLLYIHIMLKMKYRTTLNHVSSGEWEAVEWVHESSLHASQNNPKGITHPTSFPLSRDKRGCLYPPLCLGFIRAAWSKCRLEMQTFTFKLDIFHLCWLFAFPMISGASRAY